MPADRTHKLVLFAALAVAGGAITGFPASSADAQLSKCDQIEDRDRRRNCRAGVMQGETYRQEEESWRATEQEIRERHEKACRRVGQVGAIAGIGRAARAACDAPRIINDARERRRRD